MAALCIEKKELKKKDYPNGLMESKFADEKDPNHIIQIQIGLNQDWSGCIRVNSTDEKENGKGKFADFHIALNTLTGYYYRKLFEGMRTPEGDRFDRWVGKIEYQLKPNRKLKSKKKY